jgi:hypothetical protein
LRTSTPGVNTSLVEFVRALDPVGSHIGVDSLGAPPADAANFFPVPWRGGSQILLPLGHPAAASTAIQRFNRNKTALGAMAARTVRAGWLERAPLNSLAVGLLPARLDSMPLVVRLSEIVGERLTIAVRIPHQRPNSKPTLMLLSSQGRVLGFAKIAMRPLTRSLVSHEASTLTSMEATSREHPSFEVPRVLCHEQFHGVEVLVLSDVDGAGEVNTAARHAASRDIAAVNGIRVEALGTSDYLTNLRARQAVLGSQAGSELGQLLGEVTERFGAEQVAFGGWHGDWNSHNMAMRGDTVVVWDWERSGATAPLGLDVVYYSVLEAHPRRATSRSLSKLAGRTFALVADQGQPSRHGPLLLALTFLELALRFEEARAAGMELGHPYIQLTAAAIREVG